MQEIRLDNFIKVSTNKIYGNKSWHFRKKLKDAYLKWFSQFKNNLSPVNCQVELEFYFYFSRNSLDASNCSFSGKMIEDCLVQYGILKDDSYKFVKSVKYSSQKSDDKTDYCILKIIY